MASEALNSGKPIDSLLEKVLCVNILSSDYFKELYRLKTVTEVIDEIYNHVDHVEPWMTGNCRGPSTAFCLLYKFFTMKLNSKHIQTLLNHKDSPYIRAVGFLYLRYAGDPKTIWQWYEPFIEDDEEFSPGSSGKMTKMGVYVRDLLLSQHYFDTLFPRIPVPVIRQITGHLERMKLPTAPLGVTGAGGRHGSEDTARRPPSVKAALSVSFGQRAPHRASTRDSSPVRRNLPPNSADDRSRDRSDRRDDRKDERRDHDRNYDRRDRDRDLDSRPRSSYRGSRDRDRDRRDYSRDDDYERSFRDRDGKSSGRYGSSRDRYRSRSRSPSPRRSEGSREGKSPAISTNLMKLRDLYGDASGQKEEERPRLKDSSGSDVIRLGGSTWR